MQDLPFKPRWVVNTTCYESGKLFRISKLRMGDYTLGYVKKPLLKISEAVAASAGFPVGIGPLEIRPQDYSWFQFDDTGSLTIPIETPDFDELHLWDGGVYNNLADEPLFNPGGDLRSNNDFLVVSDAAGLFRSEKYRFGVQPLKRLLDIAVSQVRAVRSRALVEHMDRNLGKGIFLHIDNTVQSIVEAAQESGDLQNDPPAGALNRVLHNEKVIEAAGMKTHIQNLKAAEFDLLLRQGFEVANATYYSYVNQDEWLAYES
jgi:NTE family protein